MKKGIVLLKLIVFIFLLLSCAGNNPVYLFKDGTKFRLHESDDKSGGIISYRFDKERGIPVSDSDLFFRGYFSRISGRFNFSFLIDNTEKNVPVYPDGETEAVIYFRVPAGGSLQGVSTKTLNNYDKSLYPLIEKIEQVDADGYFSGITRNNGIYQAGEEIFISAEDGNENIIYMLGDTSENISVSEILFDFEYFRKSGAEESIEINISSSRKSAGFNYLPHEGRNRLILDGLYFEFPPSVVRIKYPKDSIGINNLVYQGKSLSGKEKSAFSPINTGFGAILSTDRSRWRFDNFELFSWNYFPSFLIIDTIDYSFQARMFKRIAFYVEKPGSRGLILANEDIEKLHGWNAHDYKADDLASFFNKSRELNFSLNPEEDLLKAILLENSVIKEEKGAYYPGNGGILSISQESKDHLRRIFITHEGYHGIFFSSPGFRDRCRKVWEVVDPELKDFWYLFLEYKSYNTEDDYLVVNEFMAYNLQQEAEKILPYFFDHIIPKLIKKYPDKADFLEKIKKEKGDEFLEYADLLGEALQDLTSLPPGRLIFLKESRDPVSGSLGQL